MPESAQISYFENYIEKLKAADAIKKAAEEKLLEKTILTATIKQRIQTLL
jgi:hypothetical protein